MSKKNQSKQKINDKSKKRQKEPSLTQKIWDDFHIALFSQKALNNIKKLSSIIGGAVSIVLITIIMIFPIDQVSLDPLNLLRNFVIVFAGLVVVNLATYIFIKLLRSKVSIKEFIATINIAVLMSLIVVTIPLALISFAIFSSLMRSDVVLNFVFSIIPFYNYLIYGWAVESVAKLKGVRSIIAGLVALFLILGFNLIIVQVLV